jgi:hypothetical protein
LPIFIPAIAATGIVMVIPAFTSGTDALEITVIYALFIGIILSFVTSVLTFALAQLSASGTSSTHSSGKRRAVGVILGISALLPASWFLTVYGIDTVPFLQAPRDISLGESVLFAGKLGPGAPDTDYYYLRMKAYASTVAIEVDRSEEPDVIIGVTNANAWRDDRQVLITPPVHLLPIALREDSSSLIGNTRDYSVEMRISRLIAPHQAHDVGLDQNRWVYVECAGIPHEREPELEVEADPARRWKAGLAGSLTAEERRDADAVLVSVSEDFFVLRRKDNPKPDEWPWTVVQGSFDEDRWQLRFLSVRRLSDSELKPERANTDSPVREHAHASRLSPAKLEEEYRLDFSDDYSSVRNEVIPITLDEDGGGKWAVDVEVTSRADYLGREFRRDFVIPDFNKIRVHVFVSAKLTSRAALNEHASGRRALDAYGFGQLHYRRKEYEDAVVAYRQAVELEPSNARFLNSLAWALCLTGEFDEALPLARKAVALDPASDAQWDTLAHAAYGTANWSEAVEAWNKRLAMDPDFFDDPGDEHCEKDREHYETAKRRLQEAEKP